MKIIFTSLHLLIIACCFGQYFQSVDTIKAPANLENIYSRPIYSDSLVSSFVIFIKKEVKPHKHVTHAEHVYILEGTGDMTVGNKSLNIEKGDIIFVPKGIIHSLKVTSKTPMKVLSIQAPAFDGKDRVMEEEKK